MLVLIPLTVASSSLESVSNAKSLSVNERKNVGPKGDPCNLTDSLGSSKDVTKEKISERRGSQDGRHNWRNLADNRMRRIKRMILSRRRGRENKTDSYDRDIKTHIEVQDKTGSKTRDSMNNRIGSELEDNWTDFGRRRRVVRREAGKTNESTLPDGFRHHYVPCSTIANFLMLRIVQPQRMRFFRETKAMVDCLLDKLALLDVMHFEDCFAIVSPELFVPRWFVRLIGFVIVFCILLLVAIFMLCLCPCLMCWQISFLQVVHAGKLDTYSNCAWASITTFSCLSMLFALFGVITVGCTGVGLGYYLQQSPVTRIQAAYDQINEIVLDAVQKARRTRLQTVSTTKVRDVSVVSQSSTRLWWANTAVQMVTH